MIELLDECDRIVVIPDIHGNHEDFLRAIHVYEEELQTCGNTHLIFLGDAVHGPDLQAAVDNPELYGYEDCSREIVAGLLETKARLADRFVYVLGNHDYAHIGGPRVSKFHEDEAAFLESEMSSPQVSEFHQFLKASAIAVATASGVFLSHGSPGIVLGEEHELGNIDLENPKERDREILRSFLTSYGQTTEVAREFLASVRCRSPLKVVVHGHDRDEDGFFTEGGNQVCPVIFGARRERKTYLVLDNTRRYQDANDFLPGREVKRLYRSGI